MVRKEASSLPPGSALPTWRSLCLPPPRSGWVSLPWLSPGGGAGVLGELPTCSTDLLECVHALVEDMPGRGCHVLCLAAAGATFPVNVGTN